MLSGGLTAGRLLTPLKNDKWFVARRQAVLQTSQADGPRRPAAVAGRLRQDEFQLPTDHRLPIGESAVDDLSIDRGRAHA